MSIQEATRVRADMSKLAAAEGCKIIIRDLQSTPVDTEVFAWRKDVEASAVEGETVTHSEVLFIVASLDLGAVEPNKNWKVYDGSSADPPAVNLATDPIGRVVRIMKKRAGRGLTSLHYLYCDFPLTS